jgi:hypothetical protein
MISMAEQETSHALSDLVADRRAALHLSLAKLADRCVNPDTGVQEWKIGRLLRLEKRQSVGAITPEQIRALAAGLDLPTREVQDAAGEQFFGVQTMEGQRAERVRLLVHRADRLSLEDVDRLIAIADALPARPDEKPK